MNSSMLDQIGHSTLGYLEYIGGLRATRVQGRLSLWKGRVPRRHFRSCGHPKRAGRNADLLQLRNVQKVRFVLERWKIRRTLSRLSLFAFGNLQPRNLQRPVLADREMDSLGQCQVADFGGVLQSCRKEAGGGSYDGTVHIFLKSL
jgi:hypothetical protein